MFKVSKDLLLTTAKSPNSKALPRSGTVSTKPTTLKGDCLT